MNETKAVNYLETVPELMQALAGVHEMLLGQGLDRKLHHLVQLRASQMNLCGFCVKMHTAEARQDNETNDRLDRLVVWRSVDDFSDTERAALAWTEAITELKPDTDYAALRRDLRVHFTEHEIGSLTVAASMINLWNRINVSRH